MGLGNHPDCFDFFDPLRREQFARGSNTGSVLFSLLVSPDTRKPGLVVCFCRELVACPAKVTMHEQVHFCLFFCARTFGRCHCGHGLLGIDFRGFVFVRFVRLR